MLQSCGLPLGTVRPIVAIVEENTAEVIIECSSATEVKWFRREKVDLGVSYKPVTEMTRGNNLVLQNLQVSDSAKFSCEGTNEEGKLFAVNAEVIVGRKNFTVNYCS